jgi:hypothetical protein
MAHHAGVPALRPQQVLAQLMQPHLRGTTQQGR